MTRDRLEELRRVSNATSWETDSCSIEIRQEYSGIDEILNPYSEIRRCLETISKNLETMRKHLQNADLRNIRINGDITMENLRNQNLSIGQKLILKFKDLKINLPNNDDFTLEARMQRTLFYGMHQEYINIWNKNEEFLQLYENKLKKNLQLHSKIMNYNPSEEEVEDLIANKQTSLFVDNILEETEKERRTLRDLLQRQSELEKLERSIGEVHALFLRIQNLVIEQNDRIQIVEYHAQQASVRVDKGTDNLEKAKELKSKGYKLKFCLIMWISIILIVFILIIYFF